MAFAYANRERYIFMYVTNRLDFGHLVNPDNYVITVIHPDLYQIFDNKLDWEKKYIHENYSENFNPNRTPTQVKKNMCSFSYGIFNIYGILDINSIRCSLQPCPDVYWFPIVNERFTKELIDVMEAYGKWSDGSNHVRRFIFAVSYRYNNRTQISIFSDRTNQQDKRSPYS